MSRDADQRLRELRRDYEGGALTEERVAADPIEQLRRWLADAEQVDDLDPTAMNLATATPDGRPSSRVVLLKGLDGRGLAFFTNLESRKAEELRANPHAALCFYWPALSRQLRVEGRVEPVSEEESRAYFETRPRASRFGAWASPQSRPLGDRLELERRLAEVAERYGDGPIPLPPYWGGFRLIPDRIELWQGRPSRLHDRLRYERSEDGGWRIVRLAP